MGSRRFLNNHHVTRSEALLSTFVQHFGEMSLEKGERRGPGLQGSVLSPFGGPDLGGVS